MKILERLRPKSNTDCHQRKVLIDNISTLYGLWIIYKTDGIKRDLEEAVDAYRIHVTYCCKCNNGNKSIYN